MAIIHSIFTNSFEEFQQVIFDQHGASEDAHNLNNRPSDFEVVLDDSHKTVSDDGHMNLYSDCVFRLTPELLDLQMLLNPLEEEFHLPAIAVEQCDILGREVEVVRVIDKGSVEVLSVVNNPSKFRRLVSFVPVASEADGLVEQDIVFPSHEFIPFNNLIRGMALLTDDEECPTEVNREESGEIEIAPVKDISGIGLVLNPIHSLCVVFFCICDAVKYGYLRRDVNLGMDFDARLGTAEMSPSEYGHAEVDGCGVDSIEPSVKLKFLCDTPLLRKGHHIESELLEDSRVSEHICFRESVPDNGGIAKSELIRPFGMRCGEVRETSERRASHKLSKDKNQQVIPVGEAPISSPVVVLGYNPPKLPLGQEHCDFIENVLSVVHPCSILSRTKIRNSSPGQYFSFINKCA